MAAGGGPLIFPVDLKHYCGYHNSSSGGSSSAKQSCCFFSSWQCARCIGLTQAAANQPLSERLTACRASLERYLPAIAGARRAGGSSSTGGALAPAPALTADQFESLMEGARLYALQRAWWYEVELQDGGSSSGSGSAAQAALAAALPSASALLAPLRDVDALRQVQAEQTATGAVSAWPAQVFEEMMVGALDAALAVPPAGGAGGSGMAVDGGGATTPPLSPAGPSLRPVPLLSSPHLRAPPAPPAASVGGGGRSDAALASVAAAGEFEFEPEAVAALSAAAEALLAEQFSVAQGLALRAGRQEVLPADLRAALRLSGLGRLVARDTPAAREEEAAAAVDRVLPGLL